MKMRFICATYRLELMRNPEKAIHCWQNGFDTGLALYEQQQWEEALGYLGSAFETSEIILTNKSIKPESARELFTTSASLFIDVLGQRGAMSEAQHVYWLAVKRLTQELQLEPQAKAEVSRQQERLYRHSQCPGCGESKIGVLDIASSRQPQEMATVH